MSQDDERQLLNRINASFFSSYWRFEIGDAEPIERRVEEALARLLPHIAAGSWPARFELGGVYMAGRPVGFGAPLSPQCRLEYYEPKIPLEHVENFYPRWSPDWLLYSDDDMGVVFKPAGLPTTPPRDQQLYHLLGYLEDHFGRAVHTPSRLDTAVSGLLLCSLSPRMNRYLQKAYERRWIEKTYIAEVLGAPSWARKSCKQPIERDPRHPVLRRCAAQADQGEVAKTRFERLFSESDQELGTTLLQAEPLTGRTHQIRLHSQYEGFPIIGDPYYGGREGQELRLISYAINLFHPFLQKNMRFEAPRSLLPQWLQARRIPTISSRL